MIRSVRPELYSKEYWIEGGPERRRKIWQEHKGERMLTEMGRAVELANVTEKDKVLDVGCGRGEVSYYCGKKGCKEVIGIDYSKDSVKISKELCRGLKNVKVMVKDVKKIIWKNRFSLIFFLDVWEHLFPEEKEIAIPKISRALKKDGRLICLTPIGASFNPDHPNARHVDVAQDKETVLDSFRRAGFRIEVTVKPGYKLILKAAKI